MAQGNIPAYEEDFPRVEVPSLPATDVIPGSDVQKATALRQTTTPPPSMQRTTLSRVGDALALIGANLGDIQHPTGAGMKTLEYLRGIQNDMQSRAAMGYIVRLNALASRDPSKAYPAMQDLSDFLEANAENIPLPIQTAADQSIKNLRSLATQQNAREALQTLGNLPGGTTRVDAYGHVLKALLTASPEMDPMQAHLIAHQSALMIPENADKYQRFMDEKRGLIVTVSKDGSEPPTFMNIRNGKIWKGVAGPGGGMEGMAEPAINPLTVQNLSENQRAAAFRDPNVNVTKVLQDFNGEGTVVDQQLAQRKIAQWEQEGQQIKEKQVERQQRPKLTEDDSAALGRAGLNKDGKKVYRDQLDQVDWNAIDAAKNEAMTRDAFAKKLLDPATKWYDATGQQAPNPTWDAYKAKQIWPVTDAASQQVGSLRGVQNELTLAKALAYRVHRLAPGQSLANAIRLPIVRASMTEPEANLLAGLGGVMGLQASRAIMQNRVSNMEFQAAADIVHPKDTDTAEVIFKKLTFMEMQTEGAIRSKLGIPGVQPLTRVDLMRYFPELSDVISKIPVAGMAETSGVPAELKGASLKTKGGLIFKPEGAR